MLVVAVLCVLLPLARPPRSEAADNSSLNIYKEQLASIERRLEKGGGNREAMQQERAEIARRLLKLGNQEQVVRTDSAKAQNLVKLSSVAAVVLVPFLTLGLYAALGSPSIPDQPLSARVSDKLEDKSIGEMVQLAEKHLEKNPDDARGWKVLANVYGRSNRAQDRAKALRQIIRLEGRNADVLAELGEALTAANGGIVPARAVGLFEEAIVAQPTHLKARVFMATALEQEGRLADALTRWQTLAVSGPDDERWKSMAQTRIERLQIQMAQNNGPQPSQEQVAAIQSMPQQDQQAMIANMVEGLSDRLADEPNDIAGWERLMRSRMVLKQPAEATAAYADAKTHFAEGTAERTRLDQLALELGLQNEATN